MSSNPFNKKISKYLTVKFARKHVNRQEGWQNTRIYVKINNHNPKEQINVTFAAKFVNHIEECVFIDITALRSKTLYSKNYLNPQVYNKSPPAIIR